MARRCSRKGALAATPRPTTFDAQLQLTVTARKIKQMEAVLAAITTRRRHNESVAGIFSFLFRQFGALWTIVAATPAVLPTNVFAADEAALKAYADGAYADVVARADIVENPDTYALAARALNAVAYFEPDRREARGAAQKAQDYAEKALTLDSAHVEAHLQAAIAIALRGAVSAPASTFFNNLPARARDHVDHALWLDPENPWALSTSAAWNLEVYRRGGGMLYGAKPEKGYQEFLKARTLAPENVAVAYEGALRVLASRREEWRAAALKALADAVAKAPTSMFEQRIQDRARALQSAVEAGAQSERDFIKAQR